MSNVFIAFQKNEDSRAIVNAILADNPNAITRFVLVALPGQQPERTGADKTTLMVQLPNDEAGALLSMLLGLATWIALEALGGADPFWPPQLAGMLMSLIGMLLGSLLPTFRMKSA